MSDDLDGVDNAHIIIPQKFKIVFVGDNSVGKTSLINRFTSDTFEASYQVCIMRMSIL